MIEYNRVELGKAAKERGFVPISYVLKNKEDLSEIHSKKYCV